MSTSPTPAEIREARKAAGLTQTQAAELAGYTVRYWQMLEAGTSRMRPILWKAWQREVQERA